MHKEKKTSAFSEWAQVTTAHGFLDFSRARTIFRKAVWFLLIFISFYLMTYQLLRGVGEYASNEWKTSVHQKRAGPEGLPMPSIVVCNANRLKYSKAQQYNFSLDMIRFLFLNIGINSYLFNDESVTVEYEFTTWRKLHNFTLEDIFENIGPNETDILPLGPIPSEGSTVRPIFTLEYGRCISIQSNKRGDIVGSKGTATFLLLDTQSWDYLPIVDNNFIYEGFTMQIVYDEKIEMGNWIMLYPGTHNSVGIQVVEESVREADHSFLNPFALLQSPPPCDRNPSMPLSKNTPYSQINCLAECVWLLIVEFCKCVMFLSHEQYRTCDIEEHFKCLLILKSTFSNNITNAFINATQNTIDQCRANCTTPCFNRYLEAQISNMKYPSKMQEKELLTRLLQSTGVRRAFTNDTIVLEVYFSSLSIKKIELYEVMNLDNLISSAGGVIGLWAGMSFLTVFQAFAYVLSYFERRCIIKEHPTSNRQLKDVEYKFRLDSESEAQSSRV